MYIYVCDKDPDWSNALEKTGVDWRRARRGARQGFDAAELSGWWWESHSMLPSIRPHIFRANDNRHNVFGDQTKPIVVSSARRKILSNQKEPQSL